jgi:hypothetical protein
MNDIAWYGSCYMLDLKSGRSLYVSRGSEATCEARDAPVRSLVTSSLRCTLTL